MADVTTQIEDTGKWYQGWGYDYQSPTGSVNDATATRPHTTTTGTTTTPATGTTTAQSSAKALISGTLGQYGLGSLADWAWTKWQNGESIDQIMLELRQTPEYKTRFPAMDALSKQGRAISEAQYINYEQSAASIFKAAGLPTGFYDAPEDFAKFLTSDIALPELQSRVQSYQQAAFTSPPEVRQALQSLYGVTPGELTAFFIDPDKALPLVQQRFAAAQAAGWSQETGFGNLTRAQAEMVGNMGLTEGQLADTFGQLGSLSGLYNPLTGTTEDQIGVDTALGAGFGKNAQDQAIIEARKQRRLAEFAGGGQVATTQQGAVGAGSAH